MADPKPADSPLLTNAKTEKGDVDAPFEGDRKYDPLVAGDKVRTPDGEANLVEPAVPDSSSWIVMLDATRERKVFGADELVVIKPADGR